MLRPHRRRDEIDVLLREVLVPGQYQNVAQAREDTREAGGRVVDGFRVCQRKGEAAAAERPLILDYFTLEGGLLDVARCRGMPCRFRPAPSAGEPPGTSFSFTHRQ